MGFSKLFSSIVHSSLWTEEDHVRLLFVTLLAIADREGYVYGSRGGLERLANIISEDHDRNPWEVLLEPDSDSSDLMRNPENQGRRIEQVQGGFRILNYSYYRSLRNDDDRREQNREAQRRHRQKINDSQHLSSPDKPASATVSHVQPPSSHAEADAEADAEHPCTVTQGVTVTRSLREELMDSLSNILSSTEMERNARLWRQRIIECPQAVAFALEDYKVRTPDQRMQIRNLPAWLTDRHKRAFKELNPT